jgi:uncharacterized protein (DUF58 family)
VTGSANIIDPSFVERLSQLSFAVEGVVDGFMSGGHRSQRRGGGLIFAEHRAYRPGDDPRTIDWRAFARSDHHRVKRFEHEAQLRAFLALDVSGSMDFGGPAIMDTKWGFGATLLGAMAEVLLRQGDAAGVHAFDQRLLRSVPARGGRAHLRTLLEALSFPPTPGAGTGLGMSIEELALQTGRHGAIVIASDALDFDERALSGLATLTARGHRTVFLHVLHREELNLEGDEPALFEGLEGEDTLEADPHKLRASYIRELAEFRHRVESCCLDASVRYVLAATSRAPHEILREALAGPGGTAWG